MYQVLCSFDLAFDWAFFAVNQFELAVAAVAVVALPFPQPDHLAGTVVRWPS